MSTFVYATCLHCGYTTDAHENEDAACNQVEEDGGFTHMDADPGNPDAPRGILLHCPRCKTRQHLVLKTADHKFRRQPLARPMTEKELADFPKPAATVADPRIPYMPTTMSRLQAQIDSLTQQVGQLQHQVSRLMTVVFSMAKEERRMSLDFTALASAVAKEKEVVASTVTLLNGLQAEIKDLSGKVANPADQQTLNQFAVDLQGQIDNLSQAVVANTPAASAPPADSGNPTSAPSAPATGGT